MTAAELIAELQRVAADTPVAVSIDPRDENCALAEVSKAEIVPREPGDSGLYRPATQRGRVVAVIHLRA